jgi:serum/glucocorticoid-regulated kinase 2
MNAVKRLLSKVFLRERVRMPNAFSGQIEVSLAGDPGKSEVRVEFMGHQVLLSREERESRFDLFNSGGEVRMELAGTKKRAKVRLKEVEKSETEEVRIGPVRLAIRYIPFKKKIGLEDFHLQKLIGKGTYGKVVLVRHSRSMRLYACKIIRKERTATTIESIINERKILSQINSPFVINLLAAFQTSSKVYLILPYIEGGELFVQLQRCGSFSEPRARLYICELVLAVEYLHSNGIIYRDIKPENILLDRTGHIVLCDFGMSTLAVSATTYCGTPEYIAPEIIRNEEYGESVDFYTLGVLLYEMLAGYSPFSSLDGEETEDLENRILFSEIEFPGEMSEPAADLISRLMNRNPKMRPNGPRIKRHRFFEGVDWGMVERKECSPEYIPCREGVDEDVLGATQTDSLDSSVYSETFQKQFAGFTYCPDYWEDEKEL